MHIHAKPRVTLMRFHAIDLLRFFAAFAVMLYHYTARESLGSLDAISDFARFGYMGVPLFFIISGFVICASAQNRSPYEFAISRFVRLYPAYWIGMAITVATVMWFEESTFTTKQIVANLTLLNDYFGVDNVDGVYWTLQVELKFYGCVFLLCLFRVFTFYRTWLTVWMAFTVCYLLCAQPFCMGWFITPSYSSYFIAGIVYYLILQRGLNWHFTCLLACSLLVSSVYGYRHTASFIKPNGIEPWISVALIWVFYGLFALLVARKLNVEESWWIGTLGGMTYPLYLIHSRAGGVVIDRLSCVASESLAVILVIVLVLSISFMIHEYAEKRIASPMKEMLLGQRDKCSKTAGRRNATT